ncbi:MAG: preprotein translocase subunit SecG [Pseudolabrys sp.]|jgi:preprotein translocase subunit SecG
MQHVVIVIHLMLVLALIGVVLLQRSEGGGLGIGGGGAGSFMSNRGAGNVLTRATAILAGLFFVTSLILSILAGMNRAPTSILQGNTPTAPASAPGSPPLGSGGGGLLNQLGGGQPATPAAPAAPATPSGPQVPQVPQSK